MSENLEKCFACDLDINLDNEEFYEFDDDRYCEHCYEGINWHEVACKLNDEVIDLKAMLIMRELMEEEMELDE